MFYFSKGAPKVNCLVFKEEGRLYMPGSHPLFWSRLPSMLIYCLDWEGENPILFLEVLAVVCKGPKRGEEPFGDP